ncbi:DUF6318 family protein [Nocardioides sp. L-11A]|uniref:DUF6318 family protein n=1 Tax=Nocardioides sp. L-11A TaxID=3043848 RepID=UPI00249AA93E|nr:DUF6318 family protein [Nocardioides sp. L-11A]
MRTHRSVGGPPVLGLLAAALVLLLSAAACSDDSPEPRDPTSTWSPTGTIDTPSPTAPPTEPELPGAATRADEEGARAFITYYWELINYAQVTGDVKALKAASGPNCGGCGAGMDGIRRLYKSGGHLEGGDYKVRLKKINQLNGSNPSDIAFEAKLAASAPEQVVVEGDGSKTHNPAATITAASPLSTAVADDNTGTGGPTGAAAQPVLLGNNVCDAADLVAGEFLAVGFCSGTDQPALTAEDVRRAFAELELPAGTLTIQPPDGLTLVNFRTNFYTTSTDPISTTVTLLGQQVTLEATPATFVWHFGDGRSRTTSEPGAAYPELRITHNYLRRGEYLPSLSTTYTGRYRTADGPWQAIPGTVTIDGPGHAA